MKRKNLINLVFVLACLSLLVFLFLAPEETTTRLPHDEIHDGFHLIESKKDAEKSCTTCHAEGGTAPLFEEHPPPYRCLFCHKRD